MSSEQEESADHVNESSANSSANMDQSFDQKGNGLREHAKPRRRRRGKKRKQKKESAATCEAENPEVCGSDLGVVGEHENQEDSEFHEWDSDENLSCDYDTYTDVIIRPINVPSAPLNSTQFIMDDHDDCRFYMSFETPNPYGVSNHTDSHLDREEGDIIEPIGNDAAYIDIDYQYESPQDFDNTAYYDKEFELSYKNNRFEELMRFSRNELINRLQSLESRFKELNDDLVKENPSPMLEKLQAELLDLQERNSYLKDSNSKLTAVLQNETECSETVNCEIVTEGISISSISLEEHFSEESDKDVYEECRDTSEVVMSDLNADSDTLKDTCDKNCNLQIHCNETDVEQLTDSCEVDCEQEIDCSEVDCEQGIDCSEVDCEQEIDCSEVDCEQEIDCSEVDCEQEIDYSEVDCEQEIEHSEVECEQEIDHSEVDCDQESSDSKREIVDSEVNWGQKIDHREVKFNCIKEDSNHLFDQVDCNDMDNTNLLKESKSEECITSCTTIINSEDIQTKHIHSNSLKIHCQPNNLVKDDVRTLNINTSDLFHIANQTKCSSLVPLEGGMSPSETSVN